MKNILFITLLYSINVYFLNAQALDYSGREELLKKQINNLSVIHDSIFVTKDEFLNGKLFSPSANSNIHPFFISNAWKPGKIWSSGKIYDIETIKYDINRDYLMFMYNQTSSAYPVYLNREYVKEFIIDGHHFRYLDDLDKSVKGSLKPGYYEVLYDGPTKFYVRWEKSLSTSNIAAFTDYFQQIYFYLKKDGRYSKISSQINLIEALDDHKKEIRNYMKTNKMRFTRNNYESIVPVLNYYDNL